MRLRGFFAVLVLLAVPFSVLAHTEDSDRVEGRTCGTAVSFGIFGVANPGRAASWAHRRGYEVLPPAPVHQHLAKLLTTMAGRAFEPSVLSVVRSRRSVQGESHDVLSLYYLSELLGQAELHVRTDTLRLIAKVPRQYRGYRVFSHLFFHALQLYPQTNRIPGLITPDHREDLEAFDDVAFGSDWELSLWSPTKEPREQLELDRKAILKGMQEMPTMRVRYRHGFQRLTKVILDPHLSEILFDVERGEPLPPDATSVIVRLRNGPHVLTSAGDLIRTSHAEGSLGANFPFFDGF